MKKITLIFIAISCASSAQIINTAPYILTVDEAKAWISTGPTASTDLIATVPLAARFSDSQTQFNPALTDDMKIAYLPDGMNNFGNYHGEQSQFNLFNFTHWQYIDKLVWFGGTASQTVQLPSSPWVNAAHKNGVKVFGDIFFSPTAFGGSSSTLQNFLEQDTDGQFVIIPKLVAMAQYYGFDGWFINQETATTSAIASKMHDFVRDFTAASEANGKEVMWYDAMILSGSVGWQNRLNTNNSPFVQDDSDGDGTFEQRVSSSIIINFFWNTAALPNVSRTRAQTIGRSQFDVFTGADIWPGRNQGDFEINGNTFMTRLHENATTPYTSLGLFAPNCVYNNSTYTNFNNDPSDYASFFNAENHMFSGDDNNPAISDASGFKGFCNWVPEASVVTTLPFTTDFSLGCGLKKFADGVQTSTSAWHDMNRQDILPNWQFAFSTAALTGSWDFDDAYNDGNSLKIAGNLTAGVSTDLMLYKTKLTVSANTAIDVAYRCNTFPAMALIVSFSDDVTQKYEFPIDNGLHANWMTQSISLTSFAGREIAQIGFRFSPTADFTSYQMNIGKLSVYDTTLGMPHHDESHHVTVFYPDRNPVFNIDWPTAGALNFTVTDADGKISYSGIADAKSSRFELPQLAPGIYIVKFTDNRNRSETRKVVIGK